MSSTTTTTATSPLPTTLTDPTLKTTQTPPAYPLETNNLSNIVNGPRVDPRVVAERLRFDLGYDADIAGRDLLAGQARQAGRLAKLWVSHPGELTKAVEAWGWRLRGTHERPQDDGATLTDRVQRLEQDGRTRWLGSPLRRHLEDRKKDARRMKWRVQRRLNESLPPAPRLVAGDLDAVVAGRGGAGVLERLEEGRHGELRGDRGVRRHGQLGVADVLPGHVPGHLVGEQPDVLGGADGLGEEPPGVEAAEGQLAEERVKLAGDVEVRVERAADAVESLVEVGLERTQSAFNS